MTNKEGFALGAGTCSEPNVRTIAPTIKQLMNIEIFFKWLVITIGIVLCLPIVLGAIFWVWYVLIAFIKYLLGEF